MKASELRQKYLDFFKSKGHTIIPSDSLIPQNDPTTLFTTAGMHPLVPYLMGEDHPGGKRVANVQKCIRTTDIDEVGDTTHHTFFEMLGNWSFGDYFKKEAIEMSWEFLTSPEWLGLDKDRLAVSVFEGDADPESSADDGAGAPFDEEAYEIWRKLGIPEKRIAKLPRKQNWWGPAGETGPCGPDTEMFYWVGDPDKVPESFNDDNDQWVEIWNDVFMEYEKTKDGKFIPLKQKNVDTGMGLERMLTAMNGLDDNYKTELFWPIIEKIEGLSGKKYGGSEEITKAMRIVADHIKAAVMIMGDDKGITPSNTDQGYIVRRLARRAIRYGKQLGVENNFTKDLAQEIFGIYGDVYSELDRNGGRVLEELEKEESKFKDTLEKGLRQFEKLKKDNIDGKEAFNLYQTYGFPLEMTVELAKESGVKVDEEEFKKELEKHQELSRTASAGKFKGGLADSGEETKKLHTAAHLMLAALRKILGDHVHQKGSNITAERLRFDFSHPEKMTDEQKEKVEKLVNEIINSKLPVICEEMNVDEAREMGAEGVFDSKYGDKVKVYLMGEFSKEICGGPHVKNTGELGRFKIIKEESSGAGVRRIKAVLDN
ncbi:MAG: alanine--tRNA ligase [Candidatus Moranbacteria bacterium]|nr:alanine--tRNA ligase [Candidatus Moranbacteria bacterium]